LTLTLNLILAIISYVDSQPLLLEALNTFLSSELLAHLSCV